MALDHEINDLALLARAGVELSVMFEWVYAPQDNPTHFVQANPAGAKIITEIRDRLVASKLPVPEELAFIVGQFAAKS